MTDYSFVKDENGNIHGMWLQDPNDAKRPDLICALIIKHDLPDKFYKAIRTNNYRLVSNTYDNAGGCFLMFGSARAPGE